MYIRTYIHVSKLITVSLKVRQSILSKRVQNLALGCGSIVVLGNYWGIVASIAGFFLLPLF